MPRIKLSESFIDKLKSTDKRVDYFDTEVKGLILRHNISGGKFFSIKYKTVQGVEKRYTIAQHGKITLAQARNIAQEKLGEIAKGIDVQHEKKKLKHNNITLKIYLDTFYNDWVSRNRKYPEKTINRLNRVFKPLHNKQLEIIDKSMLNQFLYKYKNDNSVTDATLNRLLAIIKGAMTKAQEFGFVEDNKIRGIKPFKESPHKIRYLSEEEKQRLFNALDTTEKYVRDIVITAYYTGMRRGELFGIQWKDIDFNAGHIHVHKDIEKAAKGRNIPMHKKVIEVLKNIEFQNKNDYVFKSPITGTKMDNIYKSWKKILKNSEIENFRFHDLRHNFGSTLAMQNVPIYTISQLMGHSDIKMTMRYAHLSPSHKQQGIDLID